MAVVSKKFDTLGQAEGARRCKIGIMGGTFDPIHIGHLACAEQVRESFSLDAVIFVPAGNPVYKQEQTVTSAAQRLEMCQIPPAITPSSFLSALLVSLLFRFFFVESSSLHSHHLKY